MNFLNAIADALSPKPTQQPQQQNIDHQQVKRLAAIEAAKVKQADDSRRRELNSRLADEERHSLTEKRERIISARKAAGRPLQHAELRVLDCEIELELAKKSYDRDPGQPRILGDGNFEMSKQKSRLRAADRNLKSAQDALVRAGFMTSSAGIASTQIYLAPQDVSAYTDHRKHMADTMATHKK